jgi:hypothetical protein
MGCVNTQMRLLPWGPLWSHPPGGRCSTRLRPAQAGPRCPGPSPVAALEFNSFTQLSGLQGSAAAPASDHLLPPTMVAAAGAGPGQALGTLGPTAGASIERAVPPPGRPWPRPPCSPRARARAAAMQRGAGDEKQGGPGSGRRGGGAFNRTYLCGAPGRDRKGWQGVEWDEKRGGARAWRRSKGAGTRRACGSLGHGAPRGWGICNGTSLFGWRAPWVLAPWVDRSVGARVRAPAAPLQACRTVCWVRGPPAL